MQSQQTHTKFQTPKEKIQQNKKTYEEEKSKQIKLTRELTSRKIIKILSVVLVAVQFLGYGDDFDDFDFKICGKTKVPYIVQGILQGRWPPSESLK